MRGHQQSQGKLFFYFEPGERVPADHALRSIQKLVDPILVELSPEFDTLYAKVGRPSIPPERLLKASLLIALFSVRSDRQFCEQLNYNMLFRWFLGMPLDEKTLDPSNFTRLRARLVDTDVAKQFFLKIVGLADKRGLLSSDHFSVDGTLIEAWASHKSFRPKAEAGEATDASGDANARDVNYRGELRTNDTHESTTDPEAKLIRKGKGKEAKLCFGGHALMENRNGLLVGFAVADATRTESEIAMSLVSEWLALGYSITTLGADKGYHNKTFVKQLRDEGIRPHIAQIQGRKTPGLDRRTTRHGGYQASQKVRKRIEEIFGWEKTVGGMRKTKLKGIGRNQIFTHIVGAAYNLLRIVNLCK